MSKPYYQLLMKFTVEENQFVFSCDFDRLNTIEDGFEVEYHPDCKEAIESMLRLLENLYSAEQIADTIAEGLDALDYSKKGIEARKKLQGV